MSEIIAQFDPSSATNGSFVITYLSSGVGKLVVWNDSAETIDLVFPDGSTDIAPAWVADIYELTGPAGNIAWKQDKTVNNTTPDISQCWVIAYQPRENIPGVFPIALSRQMKAGGGAITVTSGAITITSGSISVSSVGGTVTVGGTIAVSGVSGTVTIAGAVTVSNSLTIGTVSTTVPIQTTGASVVNVGTVAGTVTVSGNINITNSSINVGTVAGTVTIAGAVTITSGTINIGTMPAVTITSGSVNIGTVTGNVNVTGQVNQGNPIFSATVGFGGTANKNQILNIFNVSTSGKTYTFYSIRVFTTDITMPTCNVVYVTGADLALANAVTIQSHDAQSSPPASTANATSVDGGSLYNTGIIETLDCPENEMQDFVVFPDIIKLHPGGNLLVQIRSGTPSHIVRLTMKWSEA